MIIIILKILDIISLQAIIFIYNFQSFLLKAGELFVESSPAAGTRFINIRLNAEPPSISIDEGGTDFGDGSPPTFDPLTANSQIVVTNLPISEWKPLEAVDLLVTCTETNFKVHLNGQWLRSISYWHDPSDSEAPIPTITKLGWKTLNNAEISKVSWTYGKYHYQAMIC